MQESLYVAVSVAIVFIVAVTALVLGGRLDAQTALIVLGPIVAYFIPSPSQAKPSPPPSPDYATWAAAQHEGVSKRRG